MPPWLQWIIGTGAAVGAIGVIWTKLLRPLAQLISYLHDAIPLTQALVEHFRDNANYLPVLKEIASQFKTDSGSTLRDIVNGLAISAQEAKDAAKVLQVKAEVLEVNVAAVKELAVRDRALAADKLVLLDEVIARLKHNEALALAQVQAQVSDAQAGAGHEQNPERDVGAIATVLVTAPVVKVKPAS